jgi:hypothetical protein
VDDIVDVDAFVDGFVVDETVAVKDVQDMDLIVYIDLYMVVVDEFVNLIVVEK